MLPTPPRRNCLRQQRQGQSGSRQRIGIYVYCSIQYVVLVLGQISAPFFREFHPLLGFLLLSRMFGRAKPETRAISILLALGVGKDRGWTIDEAVDPTLVGHFAMINKFCTRLVCHCMAVQFGLASLCQTRLFAAYIIILGTRY